MRNITDIIEENKNHKKFVKKAIVAKLDFDGYYTDTPDVDADGVYAAFSRKKENPQTPENYLLVYIGIGNIKERISDHINNDHPKWANKGCYAPSYEEVVYSYAPFSYDDGLSEIEKVLVNQANPCYNTVYTECFESDCLSIYVGCRGNKGCLKSTYNWFNPKWYK